MSNKQFSLTIKALEIIEDVPKRSRSKFVSDAIVNYFKKKDIMNNYLIKKQDNPQNLNEINMVAKDPTKLNTNNGMIKHKPKKIKIDEDF